MSVPTEHLRAPDLYDMVRAAYMAGFREGCVHGLPLPSYRTMEELWGDSDPFRALATPQEEGGTDG